MFLKVVLLVALSTLCKSENFYFLNRDGGDVWVGIQGNSGQPNLHNGGFVLHPNNQVQVSAPDNWVGRFWARTWCDSNSKHCETGDCGNKLECNGAGGVPPATLVEINLKGYAGLDFYDISLVDGFNIKAAIEPINGQGDGSPHSCKKAACQYDINSVCPNNLKVGSSHGTIACKSGSGAQGVFKRYCPDAYSYDHDDATSTFTCKAAGYLITFGG